MQPTLAPAGHTTEGFDQAWQSLATTGGWFTGAQRVAIARECRAARECPLCRERKNALSPNAVVSEYTDHVSASPELPAAIVDAIHRITSDPGRLSRSWYDAALAGGLRGEEIVEITSIIGVTTIVDTMARALSNDPRALPEASGSNGAEPHRTVQAGLTLDRGWVPMVDPDSAEGMTKAMYEGVLAAAGFVFNVARSLSSVPEAIRDFFSAFFPNYSTHGPPRAGGLSRVQIELLASTTSAYNECFY